MATRKSTYQLDENVKRKLATWRVELRLAYGLPASEKAIIEALVNSTDLQKVRKLLGGQEPTLARRRR